MKNTESSNRYGPFAYQPLIYEAFLGKHEKLLLGFYCWAYNWTEDEPSYYSQERIIRDLSMSGDTYQKSRRTLERLGWISTQKKKMRNQEFSSVQVWVHVGRDDPEEAAKHKGRQPADREAYEAMKANFIEKHPSMCRPKFKMPYKAFQNQTMRIQKELQGCS